MIKAYGPHFDLRRKLMPADTAPSILIGTLDISLVCNCDAKAKFIGGG